MKAEMQTRLEKQDKVAYVTPQLTVHGSVVDITESIPAKTFGGRDGAFWESQPVTWAS